LHRINTQTRLIALLCLLVAAFGTTYWILRRAQNREAQQMLVNIRQERVELIGSLLELTGESLKNFAADYSFWDEMLQFVGTGDPEWGRVNIEVSLTTFHANAGWVLRPDGSQVYGAVRELDPSFARLPLPGERLLARLRAEKFVHCFLPTAAGILEVRTAPIQPTADSARTSPAQGWFIVARLWNAEHLHAIQRVVGGAVALDLPGESIAPAGRVTVRLERALLDWDGKRVATLRADYEPAPLAVLVRDNESDQVLFLAFGGLVILVVAFALSRWVLQPLRRLETAMAEQSPAHLGDLVGAADVFGRLASLVKESAEQRRRLETDLAERRQIEAALRQSQEELRNSAHLRARLARDLHDGVIQSIYAAGLGLEGMRSKLMSDPLGAEQRLNAAQASLNQTIREVRSFIQGLEPEEGARPQFQQALQSLVATLQSLHPVDIHLQMELAPQRLTPREEVHALQIVRECVSNAIRHGHARRIDVQFREEDTGPAMRITDNGQGFDPVKARERGGSGLANLAARAAELAARLEIRSSPGNGTGITLQFAQRSSP
jgi:signal transduction histidine kinase